MTSTTDVVVPEGLERPLKPSEAAAAKRVIKNSYASLRIEVEQASGDFLAAALSQVRQEWAGRKAEAEIEQAYLRKVANGAMSRISKATTASRARGFTVKVDDQSYYARRLTDIQVTLPGLEKALEAKKNEILEAKRRALLSIGQAELAAEKGILLACLSPQVEDIINRIPTAQDLLAQAASAQRQVTSE